MQIQYNKKLQIETIGSFQLKIECLENLNETIDQVFKYLENEGNPQALEELCPYFGVVWPAARGLAEYLAKRETSELKNKTVLELGCGLALPSLLAAKLGAKVISTDFHPVVPEFLESNIKRNEITHLNYYSVNWEKEAHSFSNLDWIIGSDILYERRYPESLAKTIKSLVSKNGKVVIADPGRPYLQNFVDAMKSLGFKYKTEIIKVPNPPTLQEVFIIEFNLGI